jgi:hypothetical protein
MCHPADTVQLERSLAPTSDVEPVGQAAMPEVASTVPACVALAAPRLSPPGQYDPAVQLAASFTAELETK